jgi:hypothetical protein
MAVDMDAIRRKLAQISGQKKQKDNFWKPEKDRTYTIRILPFTDNEGQPFKERWFYYNIGKNPGLLAPYQFNKKDPFQELITKLREEDYEASKSLLKTLYPKMRAFAGIIVRDEEDKGPRLWSFGKAVYQQILNIMLDEDYGDITDLEEGRDLKVTVTQPPGAQFAKIEVTPRVKTSAAGPDTATVKKWISEIPNLDTIYELKPYEVLEQIISAWLAGPETASETSTEEAPVSRGGSTKVAAEPESKVYDDLDAAFADLQSDD